MGFVRVTFDYQPDDPDEGDSSGMSEEEHDDLIEQLMALGAEDIRVERVDEES